MIGCAAPPRHAPEHPEAGPKPWGVVFPAHLPQFVARGRGFGGSAMPRVIEDQVGAFVPGARVEVAGSAEGPLLGLDFAVKDLFDVAGAVTGYGNPDWARTHAAAAATAPVILALLQAGAHLRGHEFHYATETNPGLDTPFATLSDGEGRALGPAGGRRGQVSGSFFHMIATEDPSA